MAGRSKFNVSADKSNRTFDGIVFDSAMEMRYYSEVVCPAVECGLIKNFELQKKYILQPKFTRAGKTVSAITYIADFYIKYADGHEEVIDIKGFPDSVALLKRKMFWALYPDMDYKWLTHVKKYGGWIEYEDLKAARRADSRARKLKEEANNGKA